MFCGCGISWGLSSRRVLLGDTENEHYDSPQVVDAPPGYSAEPRPAVSREHLFNQIVEHLRRRRSRAPSPESPTRASGSNGRPQTEHND